MNDVFSRTVALIGKEKSELLKTATVAVFGLGGVGSFALEALIRSGIGRLYIYDNDVVDKSNINRQIVADFSTVGMFKTDVAFERCRNINPNAVIEKSRVFVTPETEIPFEKFDFIVDAVDNVTAKLFLAQRAYELNIPIISVMGTGNKLNPSQLKIGDIFETHECPLCRVMRRELKKRAVPSLCTVWSDEKPKIKNETVSSMIFVPASAGLLAASYVTKKLIEK